MVDETDGALREELNRVEKWSEKSLAGPLPHTLLWVVHTGALRNKTALWFALEGGISSWREMKMAAVWIQTRGCSRCLFFGVWLSWILLPACQGCFEINIWSVIILLDWCDNEQRGVRALKLRTCVLDFLPSVGMEFQQGECVWAPWCLCVCVWLVDWQIATAVFSGRKQGRGCFFFVVFLRIKVQTVACYYSFHFLPTRFIIVPHQERFVIIVLKKTTTKKIILAAPAVKGPSL